MTEHVPVVVIGAGPTGLTTATLLAQQGIRTRVLDRWPDVYPQPRAVHLDDAVYAIIDRVGIADQFASISRPAEGLQLVDERHRVLARFRRGTGRRGFRRANMFDQPELERLLRANISRFPELELSGGVEVIDVAPGDPARVTLRGGRVITCDYLLGCDGANSLVRKRIGARMRDLKFNQRWLVVDIETSAELGLWDGVHQLCSARRAATYMRIGDTRYRWEFQLLAGETAADYGTIEALHPLIAPWLPAQAKLELIRVTEYTFRAQIADSWRRANVFLLGDAPPLPPPFIGQGLGSGLRDASNLADKLAGVLNGELPAQVLDTYQRTRKRDVRNTIRLALIVGRAMTSGGRTADTARRLLATTVTIAGHCARALRRRASRNRDGRSTTSSAGTRARPCGS